MTDFLRRNATGLVVVLLISLAGNLFLGGVLAGRFAHDHKRSGWSSSSDGDQMVRTVLERIAKDLPEEQRKPFREAMEQQRSQLAEGGQQVRDARDALRAAITTRPFDRAKFDAAFNGMRDSNRSFWSALQRAVGDALEETSTPAP